MTEIKSAKEVAANCWAAHRDNDDGYQTYPHEFVTDDRLELVAWLRERAGKVRDIDGIREMTQHEAELFNELEQTIRKAGEK